MSTQPANFRASDNQMMSANVDTLEHKAVTGSLFSPENEEFRGVVHWKRAFFRHAYPVALICMDVMLIVALFVISVSLRYEVDVLQAISRRVLLVLLFSNLLGVAVIGGYSYQTNTSAFRFISEHIIVSIGVFIGVFFVIYSFVAYGYQMRSGRSVIIFTLVSFTILSILYRYCLARLKQHYQRKNALCIIGTGQAARDLYNRLIARKSTLAVYAIDPRGNYVGGNVNPDDPESPKYRKIDDIELNSSINGLYVENYVVACPVDDLPQGYMKRLAVAQFHGNNICSYEAYLREKMMIIPPSEISMAWALEGGFLLHKNMTYDRVKRVVDIVFAIGGLVLLSPVFLLTALLVKLTSRGPVIFKQERVGKQEVPFTLYKFRSMKQGSENGSKYTAKNDDRITPVGKFLRKTRIDEIPQFWNVLKGELSLIGPRAEWTELVRDYEQKFPYYHFRHAVKPGITGWAQVNHSYGENDEDTVEKLYYDLYYVRKHSLVLDAVILVKTIYIVLFGRGQ